MNTKSIVAVIKKPKAAKATPKAAKAVVKKPKATPKVAKAVVKKPKATPKVAKAVVKKPKATPKVAKAVVKKPKIAKAVVKKPISGGVGSKAKSSIGAIIKGVLSASASRIRRTFSRQGKTPSNAVVPTNLSPTTTGLLPRQQGNTPSNAVVPTNLSPTTTEREAQLDFLKSMRPLPNILLDKIKDTYISYMDELLKNKFITAYDLLVLIDAIATDLNKFFEDFLYYYPTIIFKGNKKAYAYDLLTYQSKFVRLIENIRYYINRLGISYHTVKPRKGDLYFEPSTIVYNGILDGTRTKGMYERKRLKFFTNKLIITLEELNILDPYYRRLLNDNIYFGRLLVFVGEEPIKFDNIIIELNEILLDFFGHIQSMEINEDKSAQEDDKIKQSSKYIELVKKTARENYKIINWKGNALQSAIQLQIQEFKKDNKRAPLDYSSRGLNHT